jgi:hypothetical protein
MLRLARRRLIADAEAYGDRLINGTAPTDAKLVSILDYRGPLTRNAAHQRPPTTDQ